MKNHRPTSILTFVLALFAAPIVATPGHASRAKITRDTWKLQCTVETLSKVFGNTQGRKIDTESSHGIWVDTIEFLKQRSLAAIVDKHDIENKCSECTEFYSGGPSVFCHRGNPVRVTVSWEGTRAGFWKGLEKKYGSPLREATIYGWFLDNGNSATDGFGTRRAYGTRRLYPGPDGVVIVGEETHAHVVEFRSIYYINPEYVDSVEDFILKKKNDAIKKQQTKDTKEDEKLM